ncbi:protein pelota homolog [Zophobas morio]|jgi:protein pelota|uniref:protein pelota homolog n=1 Tax=Zophobas morio TaxID=2755281 RepID=UPI003083730B
MKVIYRKLEKNRAGEIGIIPENSEDFWHVYNILQIGDVLRASTVRRVQNESSTGSVSSKTVRVYLSLEVTNIWFDFESCSLRVSGRNVLENEYVKLGGHHTFDLEFNKKLCISKLEWDSYALKRINEASSLKKSADVIAVVMQEGLAYLCYITNDMTLIKSKIELSIPRKRRNGCSQHEKVSIVLLLIIL